MFLALAGVFWLHWVHLGTASLHGKDPALPWHRAYDDEKQNKYKWTYLKTNVLPGVVILYVGQVFPWPCNISNNNKKRSYAQLLDLVWRALHTKHLTSGDVFCTYFFGPSVFFRVFFWCSPDRSWFQCSRTFSFGPDRTKSESIINIYVSQIWTAQYSRAHQSTVHCSTQYSKNKYRTVQYSRAY